MNTFGNILRELRKEKGLSGKELADVLKVHKGSISNWETDRRSPDKEMLNTIAEYFEVSVDYLLGRTNIKNLDINKKGDIEHINPNPSKLIFANHLKQLRESTGLSQVDLAKIIGVSPSTIGMYEQGRRTPDLEVLTEIATHFQVSVDYLLGRTSIKISKTSLRRFKI
ncbi:helix-turn-helix domain-containing protein [Paraclostridium sp. AKS46]|nr:helix-turn-helix domain-containing protein [Paraclostridium sp. AKS46]